jgi:hypothetical protein
LEGSKVGGIILGAVNFRVVFSKLAREDKLGGMELGYGKSRFKGRGGGEMVVVSRESGSLIINHT